MVKMMTRMLLIFQQHQLSEFPQALYKPFLPNSNPQKQTNKQKNYADDLSFYYNT